MTGTELVPMAAKLLEVAYEAFKALHKSDSEKFENEWKKDLPRLTQAVEDGDIDTINRITSRYYHGIL